MNLALLCLLFVVACFPRQTNGGPPSGVQQSHDNSTQHGGEFMSEEQREEKLVKRLKKFLHICSAVDDVHAELDNVTHRKLFGTYKGQHANEGSFGTKRAEDDMGEGFQTEVNVLLTQKGNLDTNLVADLVKQFNKESESTDTLTPASTSSLHNGHVESGIADNKREHEDHSSHQASEENNYHVYHHTEGPDQSGHQNDVVEDSKRNEEESTIVPPVAEKSPTEMLMDLLNQIQNGQYRHRATRGLRDENDKKKTEDQLLEHVRRAVALVEEADDFLVDTCSHLRLAVYLASKP